VNWENDVNIISRPAIRRAQQAHPDAAEWLENWWQVAKAAQWQNLQDVRVPYPATDQVGRCLVFNVRGNTYRFIVGVRYATSDHGGTLFVKHFLTHAEYNKEAWKRECER
jgi:mRNA interferase HigB